MNKFEQDILIASNVKLAGISDQLRNAFNYAIGNQGIIPAGAYGLGGAGLGAIAGSSLGTPGMLGGAALGGLMGYGGANAINQQMGMQQGTDMALAGGMLGGLGANDQTDMAQTQAIIEQGQMLDSIINYLSGGAGMAQDMASTTDNPSMMGSGPGVSMPPGAMNGIGNPQQPGKRQKQASATKYAEDSIAQLMAQRVLGPELSVIPAKLQNALGTEYIIGEGAGSALQLMNALTDGQVDSIAKSPISPLLEKIIGHINAGPMPKPEPVRGSFGLNSATVKKSAASADAMAAEIAKRIVHGS